VPYIRQSLALLALLTASVAPGQVSMTVQPNHPETPILGLPFSADQDVRTVQHLADGTALTQEVKGHVYRSADGVERFDGTLVSNDPNAPESALQALILDRARHTSILLNSRLKTATVQDFPANATVTVSFLPQQQPHVQNKLVKPENQTTIDLGKKTRGMLSLVGKRTTGTIPVGAIGNDNPISVITEAWFSPDLKLIVSHVDRNPLVGERTFELTNISGGEPDPTLFLVPDGYKVIERPLMPSSPPPPVVSRPAPSPAPAPQP
jgi:hypothetical protein